MVQKVEGQIVAGSYDLPADISIKDLTMLLLAGPQSSTQSITIIEGWHRNWGKLVEVLTAKVFPLGIFNRHSSQDCLAG